jgi:hypothetical protein
MWDHRHHTNLVRIASSLRKDMIFEKDRQPRISTNSWMKLSSRPFRPAIRSRLIRTIRFLLYEMLLSSHAALAETKPSDRMIAEPSSCPAMPFSARHF